MKDVGILPALLNLTSFHGEWRYAVEAVNDRHL